MAAYYYLLASLPMLRADGGLPLTYAEFLAQCKSAVSDAKYALLENLTLSSSKGPLLAEWAKFYAALERELVRFRNQRLDRQPQKAEANTSPEPWKEPSTCGIGMRRSPSSSL